jgi:cell division protein FtsI (penicillin-binding protein 3)
VKSRIKPMTPGIPHGARIRAYLAAAVVTAGLSGVAWRAWALQVEDGDRYRALAARQHALTVEIPAPRGDVIDARGRPLAVSADADSIWANPKDIRDVTDTADKLAKLLGVGAAGLEAKLGGGHRFAWLARRVTPELAQRVREAHLAGIVVGTEPRRWYPGRAVGGTVIGRADIDGKGVDGIELAMNPQLVGHHGEGLALRDVRGKRMFADGLERPEPGATVQLSIDASIQAIAESALADTVRANKARSGVVVAIEVGTGRVVAMASFPAYDPNGATTSAAPAAPAADPDAGDAAPSAASGSTRPEPARNRAVTDAYEAGSVMKIFSVAAALDDGTVAPDTVFELGGQLVVSGSKAIRDVHNDPYLTVAGIIKRSSNVGAAKIALRLGAPKLYAALRLFGFGARTGIELPGEQAGLLRDAARWRDRDLASISFGYGLSVTPLQVAAATAAFGNRGLYVEPRIVDRVIDGDGTLLYQAQPAERRVVSERTAASMLAMLAAVFEDGKQKGTASSVVVPGFRCAGKTGTANRYDPVTHSYAERYLSSFAGLAPLDHPRLAIVAMIDEPSGSDHYGGTVAGPVFARLASEALRYLGVPGGPAVCAPGPPPPPGTPASEAPKTCVPPPPAPRTPRAAP